MIEGMRTLEHKRQSAISIDGIRPDHVERYKFAISYMNNEIILVNQRPRYVFDAGCGCGYGSYLMAYAGFFVSACDTSEEALYIAEKYYPHSNIKYSLQDVFNFPFHAEVTVAFEIIEHLHDDKAFLERINQKSEYLIGSVPNEAVVPFDYNEHRWHYRHYTKKRLEELLNNTGWKIEYFGGQISKRVKDAQVIKTDQEAGTLVFVARKK